MSKLTDLLADPFSEKRYATITYAYDPAPPGRLVIFPISTRGLSSLPSDGPSNTFFAPRIDSLPIFERSLFSVGRLSGSSDSPETSLVAIAADGAIDYFYDYAWAGRRFELYIGGEGFAFAEYGLVIILVAQEPSYADATITIPLKDVSALADREYQKFRYSGAGGAGGQGELAGKLKPDAWGYCPKVPPVYLGLDANGRHLFGVGSGPIVGVLRVYDRGVLLTYNSGAPAPGEYSVDVSTGTITLGGAFVGPIQADVLGRRYFNLFSTSSVSVGMGQKSFGVLTGVGTFEAHITVGMRVRCLAADNQASVWMDGVVTTPRPGGVLNVVVDASSGSGTYSNWIICPWGTAAGILSSVALELFGYLDYIDLSSVVALNNTQPATCGYWVPAGMNGKQLLDLLAEGSGTYWMITRFNTFRVGRVDLPSGEAISTFDETSILTIERVSTDEPIWQAVLKHSRKWSTLTLDQVAGAANPLAFTEEWDTVIGQNTETKAIYVKQNTIEIETIFQAYNQTEFDRVVSELFRQFNMFGQRRDYFKITQRKEMMSLALTNVVSIQHPRYGLSSGKKLRLIDIKEDYNTGIIEMGVWG